MAKPLGSTGEFFRRRDEWRKHPMLNNQWRHATPGLGIALVAFGIYLVGETVYDKMSNMTLGDIEFWGSASKKPGADITIEIGNQRQVPAIRKRPLVFVKLY
ncbi:hypothetical protein BUALT_Bualt15G0099100 [Buddleja alternifolia]|uniref:Uncharacterized protein n=1 Tax=Buddleja alternifolia TaxID=168488 RepID=A0AAV6WJ97_9LAMI|nr:hypothetical protein BUALT_Bualt15G0099100 [Buddleja alternifolia]